MIFNSVQFLIFFPFVLAVYFVAPKKIRNYWILIADYYFYMCWNPKYIILLLAVTIVTYFSGLILEKIDGTAAMKAEQAIKAEQAAEHKGVISRKNAVVAVTLLLTMGLLGYFKYTEFLASLIGKVFAILHVPVAIPAFDILLPVGISFFTFQAFSYTMDVYRGDVRAEHNFFKYAMYVAFFPQILSGPIGRAKTQLKQITEVHTFDFDRARDGFLLMVWGYFLKIVIADRIAIFVDDVYGNSVEFQGGMLLLATVLFAFQIYCDFAGYSLVAFGAAKILGVNLIENFNSPYLARTVADFWRRWHISLTSWFRDYLYIPLGGNRRGRLVKYRNILIVFLVSGLWHGAAISFLVWGGLNGMYQVIGDAAMPIRNKIRAALRIRTESFLYHVFSVAATFLLIDFSWIFFRAGSASFALDVIRRILFHFSASQLWDGTVFHAGLDAPNFYMMLFTIGILVIVDLCNYNHIFIRERLVKMNMVVRVVLVVCFILFLLTVGIWGPNFAETDFIYFDF